MQRNIETLIEDGHRVIQPELVTVYEVESGEMQESWVMPDPETLVERLREAVRGLESPG